jgi:hypothetical protein
LEDERTLHSLAAFVNPPVILHGFWQVFGAGVAGGLAAEVVALHELRRNVTSDLPQYLKSPFYWFISLLMVAIGGGLTCLYGIDEVQGLLAVNIGASAPLILRTLTTTASPKEPPKIG